MNRRDFLSTAAAGLAVAALNPDDLHAAAASGGDWTLGVADVESDVPRHALRRLRGRAPAGLAVYSRARWAHAAWRWVAMADDPGLTARQLFATLRRLDDEGVREIWVEAPPGDDPRWAGVLDRLQRAAAAHPS